MIKRNIYITDMLLIYLFTALTILFTFIPLPGNDMIKPVLGVIFIAFLPGYTLISFLFPRNTDISSTERLLLSFATSVAISALVGFILNFLPYGIHLGIIIYILVIFILYFSVITIIRRRIIGGDESYHPNIGTTFIGLVSGFRREGKLDKFLSIILLLLVILSISMTTYAVIKPKPSDNFTEFYILGADGKMSNYPTILNTNENASLTIRVANHEDSSTSYLVVTKYNGTIINENNISLKDGQIISLPSNFSAGNPGTKEVEYLLYKEPDLQNVYSYLHFWIKVS